MSLWLAIYLVVAPVPAAILVVHHAWQAGRTGRDVSESEDVLAALALGALWPLALVGLMLFAAVFAIARAVQRIGDA